MGWCRSTGCGGVGSNMAGQQNHKKRWGWDGAEAQGVEVWEVIWQDSRTTRRGGDGMVQKHKVIWQDSRDTRRGGDGKV